VPPIPDPRLRQAFADGELVLYLGAGVSMASGLPSWEKLILSMYFGAITEARVGGRPFSNYLYAIAEWHLRNVRQPAEVVARKVRAMFDDPDEFTARLKEVLYASDPPGDAGPLRNGNATLAAVAELCAASPAEGGVQAVINYNYDDLLETALGSRASPVWGAPLPQDPDALPVYHVHGFLPRSGPGSRFDEILLTEEQYHRAAHEDYSWSNLVQLRYLTSSVGLMVGLSMTDQNMRRLLDAIARAPIRVPTFALLKRPPFTTLEPHELNAINDAAKEYYEEFTLGGLDDVGLKDDAGLTAGIKADSELPAGVKGPRWQSQVQRIVSAVEDADIEQNEHVLRELGIEVIWYRHHSEVAEFIRQISS
jgi:hypothetical protein